MSVLQKIIVDLIEGYGAVVFLAAITFGTKWVAAHAKSARLRNIAKMAYNACSAVDKKDLSNEDKKKEAVDLLNHTYNNNKIFGNMTEQELDMHIEGALSLIRNEQDKIQLPEVITNTESEK